jgi:hypothetical protein
MFQWRGSLWPIFVGDHAWHFKPSAATPGGTTLVQEENFTGLMSFTMKEGSSGEVKTKANFAKFNADIKKKAEAM